MFVLLPKPRFAFKWNFDIIDAPADWDILVESSVIWSLATEKRLRDKFLCIRVRFVHADYMNRMTKKFGDIAMKSEDMLIFNNSTEGYNDKTNERIFGEIVCNANAVYKDAKLDKAGLFAGVVRKFIDPALSLLNRPANEKIVLKRHVLAKFCLY